MASELRELRLARGLSLGMAAGRAGVSRSTLTAWEGGTSRPRGAVFDRLLDALGADARRRARLLHQTDPAHARIALDGTPLGAPVDVGRVIRAMRGRRGTTQAELARAVGITQSAVAQWESGETLPGGETVHAVAFALGASPEEACALACAQGAPSGALPDVPFEEFESTIRALGSHLARAPAALREIVGMGLEAELWPRAARDGRWDASLAYALGSSARVYYSQGRLDEAKGAARRAMRLELRPEFRIIQTDAFSALLEVATYGGADAETLADRIEAWAEGLQDCGIKGWMLWERALRLAEMGQADDAVELTKRGFGLSGPASGDSEWGYARTSALLEVEIRAGRADRAEALLPDYLADPYRNEPARRRARILHLRGEAADKATMEAVRTEHLRWDNWDERMKVARVESRQAQLLAAGR